MATFLFIFGAVVGILGLLAQAVNSQISPVNRKRSADLLGDWYLYVSVGDWSRIPITSGLAVERFLSHMVGDAFFSLRYLAFAMILAAMLVSLAMGRFLVDLPSGTTALIIVLTTAATDTVALGLTRKRLRSIQDANTSSVLCSLIVIIVVAYVALAVSTTLWGLSAAVLNPRLPSLAARLGEMLYSLKFGALWPYDMLFAKTPQETLAVGLSIVPSCLSCALLYGTILTAFVISRSRPVLQGPVAYALSRLEAAPGGPLSALGTLLLGSSWFAWFASTIGARH
jgi:hypothetical protein